MPSENMENIKLYQELEDGTIDDICGEGYWHLEKMRDGVFCLTFDSGDEHVTLDIVESDGDIIVR